jgi:hypothetical protein
MLMLKYLCGAGLALLTAFAQRSPHDTVCTTRALSQGREVEECRSAVMLQKDARRDRFGMESALPSTLLKEDRANKTDADADAKTTTAKSTTISKVRCKCMTEWSSKAAASCTRIRGCPSTACDDTSRPWCFVANSPCDTEQASGSEDKWTYCTPQAVDVLTSPLTSFFTSLYDVFYKKPNFYSIILLVACFLCCFWAMIMFVVTRHSHRPDPYHPYDNYSSHSHWVPPTTHAAPVARGYVREAPFHTMPNMPLHAEYYSPNTVPRSSPTLSPTPIAMHNTSAPLVAPPSSLPLVAAPTLYDRPPHSERIIRATSADHMRPASTSRVLTTGALPLTSVDMNMHHGNQVRALSADTRHLRSLPPVSGVLHDQTVSGRRWELPPGKFIQPGKYT